MINESLLSFLANPLSIKKRLEMYGNSVISLVVNVELYLSRASKYRENDLDILRKERASNENFIAAMIRHKIYEYVPTD